MKKILIGKQGGMRGDTAVEIGAKRGEKKKILKNLKIFLVNDFFCLSLHHVHTKRVFHPYRMVMVP